MSKETEKANTKRLDAIIWTNLGSKSAREMADMAGVPNEEVLIRKRQLLDEIDVLTIEESRAVLMAKAQEILNDALKRSKNVQDERNYAPILTAATGSLKIVMGQLDKAEKADRGAIDQLNAMRVRELLRLIDVVVTRSIDDFASAPERLTQDEMTEIVQSRLIEVASEMELAAAK